MKLRHAPRFKRRLPVRFWHPESGEAHQAFTVDISLVGMFIGTRAPLPTGTRFRIEILEPGHNYVFQGEVARSAHVPPELQRVHPSGMGVRLLPVPELVQELIPAETREAPATATPAGRPRRSPTRYSMSGGPATRAEKPDGQPEGQPDEDRIAVYVLRFASPDIFLQIFLRHREEGGFFVPTRRPAALGEPVRISLELLQSGVEPLELDGLVEEHVHEPEGAEPRPSGMRVTFLEPEAAMEQLRAMISRLRG